MNAKLLAFTFGGQKASVKYVIFTYTFLGIRTRPTTFLALSLETMRDFTIVHL
jgi:hypothetical protein